MHTPFFASAVRCQTRRRGLIPLLLACTLVFVASDTVYAQDTPYAPIVNARAWVLADHNSGMILARSSAERRVPPGDMVKLMVLHLAFEALQSGRLSLGDKIKISKTAATAPGVRMFLRPGTIVSAEDLLKGLVVARASDAAIALAEHLSASVEHFVVQMNLRAQEMALVNTQYTNVTGAHNKEQYISAYDTLQLTRSLINRFPDYYRWFSFREYKFGGLLLHSRNALLWRDDGIDGLMASKLKSRTHLVATAKRDNMRLIVIVLGASSERLHIGAAKQLLAYGYRYFETRLLYKPEQAILQLRVRLGDSKTVAIGVADKIYVTLPQEQFILLESRLTITQTLTAPVAKGVEVGNLVLMRGDAEIERYPLVTLKAVEEGNFIQRLLGRF